MIEVRTETERLLEERGRLLDSATFLLVHVAATGRPFTAIEQDIWDRVQAKADEMTAQINAASADMRRIARERA